MALIIIVVAVGGIAGAMLYGRHVREKKEMEERLRIAARGEPALIASLRTLSSTQEQYRVRFGSYGTLKDLFSLGYIDPILATGKKSGCRLTVNNPSPNMWSCTAVPEKYGETGVRSFYVDQTGIIRCMKDGSTPTAKSPELDY